MRPETVWLDTETYNETPIREGTDRYARTAELLICSYAYGDDPIATWDKVNGEPMPRDLADHFANPNVLLTAHNSPFDQAILHYAGVRTNQRRWRCTMAQALAHSLPGSLEKLGDIYGLSEDDAKLKDGRRVMLLFCTPRPKKQKLRRATKQTHPEDWERLVQYCENDVKAMRVIGKQLPEWNYSGAELELWLRDGVINRRGFAVDTDFVHAAIRTAEESQYTLNLRTQEITTREGEDVAQVEAATQRDKLLQYLLTDHGIYVDNLQAATVEDILEKRGPDLPPAVHELLVIRLQASSTSVSKYKRLSTLVGPDGRTRYTMQFCGALRTGRWAGRGFQPHNLPRPTLKQKAIKEGIEAIKGGYACVMYRNVMEVLSSSVRGCIVAPKGRKLCVADLANIEGRGLAWLGGEEWKLQAFRDYDTYLVDASGNLLLDRKGEPERKGHDLYALAYAKAFNVSPESVMDNKEKGDGSWRQIGKVMELALGYEGGVGAFVTFAVVYGIDLDSMAEGAFPLLPGWAFKEANKAWAWALEQSRTYGLSYTTYVVCDAFKRMWRAAHPATCAFWKALETAVRAAIAVPGEVFTVRSLRIVKQGTWLRILLPSGRSLCYPGVRIEAGKIAYMGVNQYTRKWQTIRTYSGKLAENVTQAFARDVLAHSMPAVENAGYAIVLTVHDEDICESPDEPQYNGRHLSGILASVPPWAPGLPLAAEGYSDYRYRKG